MNITLVGYRGTGKSSVAPALAARLRWEAVDADAEIERRAGRSIREIFERDGEPAFRAHERGVLADLLSRDGLVIAAGGGAVLDGQTRLRMRSAGPVVWLQASVETILARLSADETTAGRRPALTGHDPRSEVEVLLAARQPVYAEVATITVETDGRTTAAIVDEIVCQLPALPGEGAP